MKLYMAVTADELELPLFATTNYRELAEKYGLKPNTIMSAISSGRSGRNNGVKFVRVEIEDGEEK